MENYDLKTYLALTGTVTFWGLSFVATKIALETFPTFTLVFIRFGLASILFLILMLRFGFPRFTRKEHGKLLLVALFEPGLYFVFETIGLQHTSASKTALIIATIPIAVTVFGTIFIGERTNAMGLIGIGLSFVGIAILVVGAPGFSWDMKGSLFGDLLIFGAVISAALYTITARDLGKNNHSSLEITGLQTIYGAIFFAPAFLLELPGIDWSLITARSACAMVYLTLFATVGAFLCYNYSLTKMPAFRAAIFINCIPVVTAIGAWFLLDEKLTLLQICGGGMVLFATEIVISDTGPEISQENPADYNGFRGGPL